MTPDSRDAVMSRDTLVVGGGVAGCLVARDLARQGFQVTLFESAARSAVGHDWWDTVEIDVFAEVGLAKPEPPEWRPGFAFTIRGEDGRALAPASMPASMINVDRKLLAARLLAAAESAGVDMRFEHRVVAALTEGDQTVGLRTSVPGADGEQEWRAPLTIDASGAAGVLRAAAPAQLGIARRLADHEVLHAYRAVLPDLRPEERSVITVGPGGGAQWLSREHDGVVDLFAGVIGTRVDDDTTPRGMAEALALDEGGVGEEAKRGGHGARIPLRRSWDSLVAPGLAFVGDSACMANPLNGSGITVALRSAALLARVAGDALRAGRVDMETLWSYSATYHRTQGGAFARLELLQRSLLSLPQPQIDHLFRRRLLPEDGFWTVEDRVDLRKNPATAARAVLLADQPALLAALATTFARMTAVDAVWALYPRRWNPLAFALWRTAAARVMA